MWPFKWNLFERTFTLIFSILHDEIWKFCWILILVTFGSESVKWWFSRVVENSRVGKLVYCSATLSGRTRRVLKYYAGSTNLSFQQPRIQNFVAEKKHAKILFGYFRSHICFPLESITSVGPLFQNLALLSAVFVFSHTENMRTRQSSFHGKAWPKITQSINVISERWKLIGNWLLFPFNLERSRFQSELCATG